MATAAAKARLAAQVKTARCRCCPSSPPLPRSHVPVLPARCGRPSLVWNVGFALMFRPFCCGLCLCLGQCQHGLLFRASRHTACLVMGPETCFEIMDWTDRKHQRPVPATGAGRESCSGTDWRKGTSDDRGVPVDRPELLTGATKIYCNVRRRASAAGHHRYLPDAREIRNVPSTAVEKLPPASANYRDGAAGVRRVRFELDCPIIRRIIRNYSRHCKETEPVDG